MGLYAVLRMHGRCRVHMREVTMLELGLEMANGYGGKFCGEVMEVEVFRDLFGCMRSMGSMVCSRYIIKGRI